MRLIDADELLKSIIQMSTDGNVFDKIRNAPTIQPRNGKWIDEGLYAECHSEHEFRCSECGGHIIEIRPDDFCKHCGADMRGEQE